MRSVVRVPMDSWLTDRDELCVLRFGIHELMPPKMVHHRACPDGEDYLFMWFYDPVSVGVGDAVVACERNRFIVWDPGLPRLYGNADERWDHSWLHCSGRVVAETLARTRLPLHRPLAAADPDVFDKYMSQVHAELVMHEQPHHEILQNLFRNWILDLRRSVDARTSGPRVPDRFLESKRYIEENFSHRLVLGELARRAGLSVPQFAHEFKRHFKVSPISHQIRLRLQHAAFLLRDVNRNIGEVGREVGYEDLFHFSKMFKRHFGVSPRGYRQRTG